MNNLIGISGRKNVGKDLLYHIINYIVYNDFENITLEGFDRWQQSSSPLDAPYENKKFADKLKDIVCLLIGCTRDQLEDEEFKDKELGEEWWRYEYGKSLYCYLTEKTLLTRVMNSEFFEPCTEGDLANCLVKLTPRLMLQLIGTQGGRDLLHPQIWINSLFSEYDSCDDLIKYRGKYQSKWIITDTRFSNEVKAIEDRGGIVINLIRPGIKQDNHESETALDNHVFEHTIINDGTIEDLIEKTLTLLKTIKNG